MQPTDNAKNGTSPPLPLANFNPVLEVYAPTAINAQDYDADANVDDLLADDIFDVGNDIDSPSDVIV